MIESGIINVYKPQDYTSRDVVNIVRGVCGTKRVGHTGTLDPMATGVLCVCIGSSGRIMDYLDLDLKTYDCTMQLGKTSSTQDIWGEITEEKSFEGITEEAVRSALEKQVGNISQIPPKYSAVRVEGRRLYSYAHADEEVEIKPRAAYIESIKIEDADLTAGTVRFTVTCGKGTYIRTICHDVGIHLGCGACMIALTRTRNGILDIKDSINIEDIKNMTEEELVKFTNSPSEALVWFGKITLSEKQSKRFSNGNELNAQWVKIKEEPYYKNHDAKFPVREEYSSMYNVYTRDGEFLGTGIIKDGELKSDKVFAR